MSSTADAFIYFPHQSPITLELLINSEYNRRGGNIISPSTADLNLRCTQMKSQRLSILCRYI